MPFVAIDGAESYASSRGGNIPYYDTTVRAFFQAVASRDGTRPGASTYNPATMDHDYQNDRFAITSNGVPVISFPRSRIQEQTASRVFWRENRDGKCHLAELIKNGINPDGTDATQVLITSSGY